MLPSTLLNTLIIVWFTYLKGEWREREGGRERVRDGERQRQMNREFLHRDELFIGLQKPGLSQTRARNMWVLSIYRANGYNVNKLIWKKEIPIKVKLYKKKHDSKGKQIKNYPRFY